MNIPGIRRHGARGLLLPLLLIANPGGRPCLAGSAPDHLLITEVCTLGTSQEFVEITNPTAVFVDLGDYYLTDATYAPGHTSYWRIVEPNPISSTAGGGAFTDFHARFPAGLAIAPGRSLRLSIAGSNAFFAAYGCLPDLEFFEDGPGPDGIPEMREAFAGSNVGPLALTNASESIVLYRWDGQSDLVTDVDMFVWGVTSSILVNKTAVAIDGPDADAIVTSYFPDTSAGNQRPNLATPAFGQSYHRVALDEGLETSAGGNGFTAHDETSEDWATTFAIGLVTPTASPVPASPLGLLLSLPRPNPFNPRTTIRIDLPEAGSARLSVFDVAGRLVRTLIDDSMPQGSHEAVWDGRDASGREVGSGSYLARLEFGGKVETARMGLVR